MREPNLTNQYGHPLPEDWAPELHDYEYGYELGLSESQIKFMAEDMRLWAHANANRAVARKKNWSKAFKGWMRRELLRDSLRQVQQASWGNKQQYRNKVLAAVDVAEQRKGGSAAIGERIGGYEWTGSRWKPVETEAD